MDRGNSRVSYLYRPLHPAILRSLRRVVEAGHAAGHPGRPLRRDGFRDAARRGPARPRLRRDQHAQRGAAEGQAGDPLDDVHGGARPRGRPAAVCAPPTRSTSHLAAYVERRKQARIAQGGTAHDRTRPHARLGRGAAGPVARRRDACPASPTWRPLADGAGAGRAVRDGRIGGGRQPAAPAVARARRCPGPCTATRACRPGPDPARWSSRAAIPARPRRPWRPSPRRGGAAAPLAALTSGGRLADLARARGLPLVIAAGRAAAAHGARLQFRRPAAPPAPPRPRRTTRRRRWRRPPRTSSAATWRRCDGQVGGAALAARLAAELAGRFTVIYTSGAGSARRRASV